MTEENKQRVGEVIDRVTVDSTPWLILLTILLLVGKVVGWWVGMSWLWVFSPLWIPFAFVIGLLALLVCGGITALVVAMALAAWESR